MTFEEESAMRKSESRGDDEVDDKVTGFSVDQISRT
jgi:hypothetical protein